MTAPRARRGRTYASGRYPEGYVTWVDLDPDGNPIFRGESTHNLDREMRMISRRRML